VVIALIFILLCVILGGVAWVRFFPKTPDVVALIVICLATVGICYGGFFLSTTDFFAGKTLHSIIDRGESRKIAKAKANVLGEHTISGDNFTGFSRLEDDQRASELASDTEAFSKFFLAGVMTKRATLFKRGETVILEDAEGLLSSKVKLRRKGEAVSYWTNREAID
jgi:hypothetical protein